MGATITAHHLLLDRNDMLAGVSVRTSVLPAHPETRHAFCRGPPAANSPSTSWHRQRAPTPGPPRRPACGCAGVYTAHAAIELYAEVFAQAGALDKLEASPASTDRTTTGCRATRTASPSPAPRSGAGHLSHSMGRTWCPSGRVARPGVEA